MRKRNLFLKISALVISLVLIAAMALCMASCGKDNGSSPAPSATAEVKELGEGETQFNFYVVYEDGKTDTFSVKTDKATVGEALLDAGLISGSDSEYGLFVDTVNGVKLDWNTDGAYWALYEGDTMASEGVSSIPATEGAEYSFRYTKG